MQIRHFDLWKIQTYVKLCHLVSPEWASWLVLGFIGCSQLWKVPIQYCLTSVILRHFHLDEKKSKMKNYLAFFVKKKCN